MQGGEASGGKAGLPLVVDLDGTLIRTDLLVESFLSLLAKNPIAALASLLVLFQGKAAFKAHLAGLVELQLHSLPLDPAVVALIEAARGEGRPVWLASASHERYVTGLAEHLGWFDGVLASTPERNLAGRAKADALIARFGRQGFAYAGNAKVDLAIWEHSAGAFMAGGSGSLARSLRRMRPEAVILEHKAGGIAPYLRAMRPHQWLKNVLIFVPATAGHVLMHELPTLIVAFLAFSLCASSVYITNDLLDLPGDRDHPRKRNRPLASGAIPAVRGALLAMLLLVLAFATAFTLGLPFLLSLGVYMVVTSAYSLYLKRKPVVDVIVLACLYGMRIVAGGSASDVVLSVWLVAFGIFLFLSLALVKRCAELVDRIKNDKGDPSGRGYVLSDLPVLESMAAAAGYNAALVLAIYINSAPERLLYAHPERLWLLIIVLIAWISRILVLTRRGHMNDDPVIFAVRDRWSLVLGGVSGLVLIAASLSI